jgi:hypothetical protein
MKNLKNPLALLSMAAVSGLIAVALTTPVSAKTTALVVTGTDSKVYEYNYEALKTSAVDYAMSGANDSGAKLYNDFITRKSSISAFYDDSKTAYVDANVVNSAALDAVMDGKTFVLDTFTSAASTSTIAVTSSKVTADTSGNILINGQATTTTGTNTTGNTSGNIQGGNPTGGLKTSLDALVTAGTITEAQETTVVNLFTPPTNTTGSTCGNTSGSTGGSTTGSAPSNTTDGFKTKLDALVTAGTITEAQETSILTAIQSSNSGGSGQNGNGQNPGGQGGSDQNGTSTTTTGTAAYSQSGSTATKSNQTITASNTDESGVKVTDSGTFTLSNSTIKTSGDTSSMDNSSFYGLNAAALAESGSKITLSNTKINTTGKGANGVFACGTGSTVNLSNVDINCTNTGAHGVDATKAGVLNLNNVNIITSGDGASAAIATDRGGGTINVTGGVVTTNGTKSPGVYSTGDITVSDATIKTNKSEAVTVEGENSVKLTNCSLTSEKNYGAFIYQSFSGDAEVGSGSFTMEGGSLTANEGPMFYSTNTTAEINLKSATLNNASGVLLKAGADQWGTTGSNGSNVTLNADSQSLVGSIVLDNISTASLNLKNSSSLKSTVNADNTAKLVAIALDTTSTWNVTGNSYVTSITDGDTTLANINDNGYTIYYNSSDSKNSWLNGKTYTLKDGGKLTPMTTSN